MIKALLDSGASATLITEKYTKKLKNRQVPQGWSTPGGELNTNKMVKSQSTMPELQDDKLIEWNMDVTKDLGNYDMIIGRDILQFLGINIQFSTQEVVWDYTSMPFKDFDVEISHVYLLEIMRTSWVDPIPTQSPIHESCFKIPSTIIIIVSEYTNTPSWKFVHDGIVT
jgi:Retroviral aspartyl protease